eukprot:CAMPEP_0172534048 /NCGR_PEP_ID=MMETSP1067-20121228/6555_1 /TAXON_ID=265564 ORGANISM="Thalassiosira punctigera, Strain Tpunct2005C2" /NCGR_SAMPLE_ID=MMETSP1067 /ASSEMBLY_ACC=CAM_ASM_000444 /LENGTH=284 /DNA_ID=CAMNT_0013318783 /DNA_START=106 /DNA_END=960 /DNA_ORIENTATION=-
MAAFSYRTNFMKDSDLLDDVESLCLSELSELSLDLDDGERLFAGSRNSDLDVMLSISSGLASVEDFVQFDKLLESSCNHLIAEVDAVQEKKAQRRSSHGSRSSRLAGRGQRSKRSWDQQEAPDGHSPRFQINGVDFDPHSQHQRQTSNDDPPTCLSKVQPQPLPLSDAQYKEALRKLAQSMKQTEESRRQVMMQRDMLTPVQRQALSSAKDRLNRGWERQQVQQVVPAQALKAQGGGPTASTSTIMDAFFSGSRGTLTVGLQQSRQQLAAYMSSVSLCLENDFQ